MKTNCLPGIEEGEELNIDKVQCWKVPRYCFIWGSGVQRALSKLLAESNQPCTAY